jgi:hypothetical protein
MTRSIMYHDGNRRLQDRFDSRRISDRLEEKLTRRQFSADDKAFIEGVSYFFLATADAEGRPDCSYKGGMPGFVRVTGPSELAFPDYDGNGMFKSLGNILVNPSVGMLFIAMHGRPQRLRVNGEASISDKDFEFAGLRWHPKWSEVNLAATLTRWPRFPTAKEWLGRTLREQTASVQREFDQFLQVNSPPGDTLARGTKTIVRRIS